VKHRVKVSEVPSGDLLSPESGNSPQFISLRQMIDRFGGYEFELELASRTEPSEARKFESLSGGGPDTGPAPELGQRARWLHPR
jgi:hypothetical protein